MQQSRFRDSLDNVTIKQRRAEVKVSTLSAEQKRGLESKKTMNSTRGGGGRHRVKESRRLLW